MSRLEEHHRKLQQILCAVRPDLADDAKLDIRQRLIQFMSDLPAGPEFTLLYDTANETSLDLGKQITAAAMGRLSARMSDLSYQVGILQSVAKKAEADAQALSLRKIQLVATAVKDTTDSITRAWDLIDQKKLDEAGPFLQKALDRMIQLTHDIAQ